ncbi:MAG: hypothetical protein WA705_19940 [Candidatus Ozemobacteraceae bacterium]
MNMFALRHLVFACIVTCCFCCSSTAAFAECFTSLELTPLPDHGDAAHVKNYRISYFSTAGGKNCEVYPTYDQKLADLDLVTAGISRRLIENEFEAKGIFIDDTEVVSTGADNILALVATSTPYTPAWKQPEQKRLAQYLVENREYLKLFLFNVITDHAKGWESDILPLLIRFNGDNPKHADEVTVIFITKEAEVYPQN